MYVVPGSASGKISAAVAQQLDARIANRELKTFPDGEVYARIDDDLEGEDVLVIGTTLGNDRLLELLLLLDAAHARRAASVVAVVPYYAYSRQDQRFKPGEALSAELIARALGLCADALVTVDPHKEHVLRFFPAEAVGPSAVPELAAAFSARDVDVVLAPDKGALDRAQAAAKQMGVRFDYLEKTRISGDEVLMKTKSLDVDGATVAIIDDIISTGGTMATATLQLKQQGAQKVFCAATHGLFTKDATTRLAQAGVDEVVATDTIEGPHSLVSAAPAVVRGVREVLGLAPHARPSPQ